MSKVTMWRSRWRCVIKSAYSFSFLLSINIFVWQNVLYFLDAPPITWHSTDFTKSYFTVTVTHKVWQYEFQCNFIYSRNRSETFSAPILTKNISCQQFSPVCLITNCTQIRINVERADKNWFGPLSEVSLSLCCLSLNTRSQDKSSRKPAKSNWSKYE